MGVGVRVGIGRRVSCNNMVHGRLEERWDGVGRLGDVRVTNRAGGLVCQGKGGFWRSWGGC